MAGCMSAAIFSTLSVILINQQVFFDSLDELSLSTSDANEFGGKFGGWRHQAATMEV